MPEVRTYVTYEGVFVEADDGSIEPTAMKEDNIVLRKQVRPKKVTIADLRKDPIKKAKIIR